MNKIRQIVFVIAVLVIVPAAGRSDDRVEAFHNEIRTKVAAAENSNQTAVAGKDGWLFFVPDLRALTVRRFWGEDAKNVSKASKPEHADPLEPILDFKRQLSGAGIELIIVPVPSKAVIYPDKISDVEIKSGEVVYFDPRHQEFYKVLREQGVNVLDLVPQLFKARESPSGLTYCKTDSHWSGLACSIAARLIAVQLRERKTFDLPERKPYSTEMRSVEISGDLLPMVSEEHRQKETLPLVFAGTKTNGNFEPVNSDRNSPVLLMGDSHVLVFHDPTLHAAGAGLPDHLALELGIPVDVVGVRGSASVATLVTLLRRKDNLAGKKVVLWVMSMREFTESVSGWRKVPVIR
jgi:SGNH hydrolase-like domain, acetyltransferase AlgX